MNMRLMKSPGQQISVVDFFFFKEKQTKEKLIGSRYHSSTFLKKSYLARLALRSNGSYRCCVQAWHCYKT